MSILNPVSMLNKISWSLREQFLEDFYIQKDANTLENGALKQVMIRSTVKGLLSVLSY